MVVSSGFAVGVGFLTCHDLELTIACLTMWVGVLGLSRAGALINIIEIAPK